MAIEHIYTIEVVNGIRIEDTLYKFGSIGETCNNNFEVSIHDVEVASKSLHMTNIL